MRESPLPGTPDGIYALLSVVSYQGAQTLEDNGQSPQVPFLQLGNRQGLLELLSMVQRTGQRRLSDAR